MFLRQFKLARKLSISYIAMDIMNGLAYYECFQDDGYRTGNGSFAETTN
jgi:hypothetical protein